MVFGALEGGLTGEGVRHAVGACERKRSALFLEIASVQLLFFPAMFSALIDRSNQAVVKNSWVPACNGIELLPYYQSGYELPGASIPPPTTRMPLLWR